MTKSLLTSMLCIPPCIGSRGDKKMADEQAARFSGLCYPPSLHAGPSPRRAPPPAPNHVVQQPRPPPDGAVSADIFVGVVTCFVRAVHCTPPLAVGDGEWVLVENGEAEDGDGERGEGIGFGPEHLGEVDGLSRLASTIYRYSYDGCFFCYLPVSVELYFFYGRVR